MIMFTNPKLRFIPLLIVVTLSFLSWDLDGQTRKNPFEIRNRSVEKIISIVDTTAISSPQDVTHNELKDNQTNQEYKSNPFEVNHIPLRRKDVKVKDVDQKPISSVKKTTSSKGFVYWLLLGALVLLVLATSSQRKLFSNLTRASINENILKLEHRAKKGLSLEYILLYLIYYINGGIFLMLLAHHFAFSPINIQQFLYCALFLIAVYVVKHISLFFVGSIFPIQKETSLYSFAVHVYNGVIGIALFPINLLLTFGDEKVASTTLFIGLGFVGLLLFIRYVRGLAISISYIFNNIILFFIYLCTLEIAPILILVKFLEKL